MTRLSLHIKLFLNIVIQTYPQNSIKRCVTKFQLTTTIFEQALWSYNPLNRGGIERVAGTANFEPISGRARMHPQFRG
jgi:hypothetical protein